MTKKGLARWCRLLVLELIAVVWAAGALVPIAFVLLASVKSRADFGANPYGLPQMWKFSNYVRAWNEAEFGRYFQNSFIVTAASVLAILSVSTLAAYALARSRIRGTFWLSFYFVAGMIIPFQLIMVPLYQLLHSFHLVGGQALTIGGWPVGSFLALILTYTAGLMPMSVLLLTGFIRALPGELEDAAFIDGCTPLQAFFRVMLPLIWPAVVTVALLSILRTWNDFFTPLVLIQNKAAWTIPLGLTMFFGQYQTAYDLLFAGLGITMVPVLIIYALFSRQFIRGVAAGALKG